MSQFEEIYQNNVDTAKNIWNTIFVGYYTGSVRNGHFACQ